MSFATEKIRDILNRRAERKRRIQKLAEFDHESIPLWVAALIVIVVSLVLITGGSHA